MVATTYGELISVVGTQLPHLEDLDRFNWVRCTVIITHDP